MSNPGPLGMTPPTGAIDLAAGPPRSRLWGRWARGAIGAHAGLLGLGGLVLTTALISVGAANTNALLPESARPAPPSLAGPFSGAGLDLHSGGMIALLALSFAAYLVTVRAAPQLSPRLVLITIAAVHALVLLAAPVLSTDVFSYQAYARIWSIHGADPYTTGPHLIADNPVYAFIGAKWTAIPTAYGPLFTAFSRLLAPLSIAASAFAYKALAGVASLATAALVWRAARLRGLNPTKATALVALNPLLVVYGVGGGHNDLLMLALLVAGIYALLAGRDRAAGALPVIAAAVKLTAGVFLPFFLAAQGGLGAQPRRRNIVIGAGVAAAGVLTLSVTAFGGGPLHLLGTLEKAQGQGDWHSVPGLLYKSFGWHTVGHVVGWLLELAFVGVFAWLVREVWRGRLDWIDGAGWTAGALLLTAGSMEPWYAAWLLPFVALAHDRRLARGGLVLVTAIQAIALLGLIPPLL